jgi:Spy/CpxP family protein refolding chaperone
MKTWLKRTLIGALGASVLLGGLAAWAHRTHHHHRFGWHALSEDDAAPLKARLIEEAARRLELDAAQQARLGLVADRLREQRNALVAGAHPRDELRALVAGSTFDRDRARALVEGKTAALQTGSPALIAALGDFYDSLRPEQQARLRELMARGHAGRRG